jgi:biotin carboxylase
MNVVFLAPGYPPEMPDYVRGLAEVGATVLGVGDSPAAALPDKTRRHLGDYLQVPGILDEDDVLRRVVAWCRGRAIDHVEALWEPLVLLAARIREALGVPGMTVDTVRGFRDKQLMKERVAAAGLRVPYAYRCRSSAEVNAAAERVGFPLIVKPIAGAGSADTYRVDDVAQLARVLTAVRHVPEVSVEEFVEGDEYTYDTVCVGGRPVFENVAQYLPRPLVARTEEWISPAIVTVRDLGQPHLQDGLALGRAVLGALGMGTGITHMEWYRKANGEVVFGEIGCRPGGARLIDQMNLTCDTDLFVEWARAVCHGRFEGRATRRYNVAIVFKRARGEGIIRRVDGVERLRARIGDAWCFDELLPVGTRRRDWKQTLVSDGFVMLRHPDWSTTVRMAMDAAEQITLYASP